jgi:hypothetical protein
MKVSRLAREGSRRRPTWKIGPKYMGDEQTFSAE